jgi:hypothetical protein
MLLQDINFYDDRVDEFYQINSEMTLPFSPFSN